MQVCVNKKMPGTKLERTEASVKLFSGRNLGRWRHDDVKDSVDCSSQCYMDIDSKYHGWRD